MKELTENQIQEAHREWSEIIGVATGLPISGVGRKVLSALSKHLQLPWDDPTEEESGMFHGWISNFGGTKVDRGAVANSLRAFIEYRNRKNLYRPDPRRAKIIDVLKQYPDRAPEIADKIIAALDEVK